MALRSVHKNENLCGQKRLEHNDQFRGELKLKHYLPMLKEHQYHNSDFAARSKSGLVYHEKHMSCKVTEPSSIVLNGRVYHILLKYTAIRLANPSLDNNSRGRHGLMTHGTGRISGKNIITTNPVRFSCIL